VVTVADAPAPRRSAAAAVADVVVAGEKDVDFGRALAALGERGARSVLCEGGPSLNGQLALAGLLDELCLTVAPVLAGGGDARRIVTGPPLPGPGRLVLHTLCESDGYLFLRYRSTAGLPWRRGHC
jgi:riboflavin biosynthesis pyrimidine reductase